MGADIHILVEHWDGGAWSAIENPSYSKEKSEWRRWEWGAPRSYGVFDALAGVRAQGPVPRNFPRGLPGDMSEQAKDLLEGFCHSASAMSATEFCRILTQEGEDEGPLVGYNGELTFHGVIKGIRALPWPMREVRVLFGFDS